MQPKDYIAIVALLFSAVSLFMSVRNGGFSRRTKLLELRVLILSKVSEASLSTARVDGLNGEISTLARRRKDEKILDMLPTTELKKLQSDLDELHSQISKEPVENAIQTYEDSYHQVVLLCDRSRMLEERYQYIKSLYQEPPSVSKA